jgi:hypothetical protein
MIIKHYKGLHGIVMDDEEYEMFSVLIGWGPEETVKRNFGYKYAEKVQQFCVDMWKADVDEFKRIYYEAQERCKEEMKHEEKEEKSYTSELADKIGEHPIK